MVSINNSMAFDPVLALVANDFFQQDLDFFTSLREAGIAEEDFGDYTVNDQGEIVSSTADRVRSLSAQPQPDPFEVDGAGIGLTDEEIFAQDNPTLAPAPPLNYSVTFEDGLGFVIVDNDTGSFVETGFDSAAAAEQALAEITGAGLGTASQADVRRSDNRIDQEALDAANTKAKLEQARQQFQIQQRYNQTTQGDWRVIIRLAPGAGYLYKAPGIASSDVLYPLVNSDGVIFPYIPTISTNYVARYDPYELVHANYRGFFYKNSHVGEIQINGVFTAQDTAEAQYLLAVIHFFRSCTKMFYGQDTQFRGSPPPLVELSGFGQYQFNNHPCLVSNFNYTLPNGVDYIRMSPNNLSQGLNLADRRNPISTNTVSISSVVNRLKNAGLLPGAQPQSGRSDLGAVTGTTSGTVQTTYVPTKMEIQLQLLPVQTRDQVSRGFSLEEFARGRLLTGGFW